MKTLPNIPETECNGIDDDYAYRFLERAKKSFPWTVAAIAKCGGRCCFATAEDYFGQNGFKAVNPSLSRLVDSLQWHRIQVSQHLKSL